MSPVSTTVRFIRGQLPHEVARPVWPLVGEGAVPARLAATDRPWRRGGGNRRARPRPARRLIRVRRRQSCVAISEGNWRGRGPSVSTSSHSPWTCPTGQEPFGNRTPARMALSVDLGGHLPGSSRRSPSALLLAMTVGPRRYGRQGAGRHRLPAPGPARPSSTRLGSGRFDAVAGSVSGMCPAVSARAVLPSARSPERALCGVRPPAARDRDRADRHAKIYVGRSRHWVIAWLWFLS